MLIILVYVVVITVIRQLILDKTNRSMPFVLIAGGLLFTLSAFRHIEFGPDTIGYVMKYNALSSISLSQLWLALISGTGKDTFFYIVSKVINLSGASAQVWLAMIALVFCWSVTKFIFDYSEEAYLSYIALLSLGYVFFSLSGLRQTIAIAVLLLSYKYLVERRLYPFLTLVLFASLFHASALIFLIAYPIALVRFGLKHFVVCIVAMVMALYFPNQIRAIIGTVGWTEALRAYALREATLNLSGFIIQLSILLFCAYYRKGVLDADHRNLAFYNLLTIGLVFQSFAVVVAEAFRVSLYFSIFGIVLIPKAINAQKNKWARMLVHTIVTAILLLYFVLSNTFTEFRFYWQ